MDEVERPAPPRAPSARVPAAGDRLTSSWTLTRVEVGEHFLRFVVGDRGGRSVGLRLDADPRVSSKSPVRPLSLDDTDVPLAELALAAERLAVLLIHASPGRNPFRVFPQLVASARAMGAQPVGAAPRRYQLLLGEGLAFEDAARAEGSDEETVAAADAVVAALTRSPGRLRIRAEPSASEAWRAELLLAIARHADASGVALDLRYRLHAESAAELASLVPLSAWMSDHACRGVRFAIELVDQPFATLVGLPDAVREYALFRNGLHSPMGMPLCWFSNTPPDEHGRASSSHGSAGGAHEGATFGPACGECTLRSQCTGVSTAYAERFGWDELRPLRVGPDGKVAWDARARWMLVERPFRSLRLGAALPVLPDIACVRPWTRFELHEGGTYGPCGCDFMQTEAPPLPPEPDLPALWDGPLFQAFRRAMRGEGHPETCRTICPVYAGRTDAIERWWMKGGSAPVVENQIETAHAMLEGREKIGTVPISFNVATTSFCNYDCLMCECGRKGTLKDEKTAPFYERLADWEDRMVIIEANGGEPMASPNYRAFVKRIAASDRPASLQITTNGSLMTPRWLHGLPRLPYTKICISLNAASDDTYLAVNRGIPWASIRRNVEALLALRDAGHYRGIITYSMVVLRRNLHEVRAFAEMAIRDGTEVRYMLPMRELDGQTVMTTRDTMVELADALEDVLVRLRERGMTFSVVDAEARLKVLRQRLADEIYAPL